MNPAEFANHLDTLPDDQLDALVQERIGRLNPEQQKIAQAREAQKKVRLKLIHKIADPNATPEDHEMVFDALRDMDGYECEHGRHYVKHCIACGEIDGLMFPELFDKDGFRLDENE